MTFLYLLLHYIFNIPTMTFMGIYGYARGLATLIGNFGSLLYTGTDKFLQGLTGVTDENVSKYWESKS